MRTRDLQSSLINSKLIFTLIFVQICIQNDLKLFIKYIFIFLKKIPG
jgi:hypothetical protein